MYDNFTKTLQKKSVKSQENREMFIKCSLKHHQQILAPKKKTFIYREKNRVKSY